MHRKAVLLILFLRETVLKEKKIKCILDKLIKCSMNNQLSLDLVGLVTTPLMSSFLCTIK